MASTALSTAMRVFSSATGRPLATSAPSRPASPAVVSTLRLKPPISAAGWHQAAVNITVTTPRLDAALALVAQAVTKPAFQAAELARLRDETLDELKLAYARPGTLASLAVNRMLFGDGAYGHPASGTPASLTRITRDDVVQLHRQRYRPDNAVLVLAGDVDAAQALALAQRHFGTWRSPEGEMPAVAPAAVQILA